jgi:hypothetical protein
MLSILPDITSPLKELIMGRLIVSGESEDTMDRVTMFLLLIETIITVASITSTMSK